jgi:carbonic anhydrase
MMETIKAHVQFQLDNLKTYRAVSKGLASGEAAIHGWIYNMECGEVLAYDPERGEWRDVMQLAAT